MNKYTPSYSFKKFARILDKTLSRKILFQRLNNHQVYTVYIKKHETSSKYVLIQAQIINANINNQSHAY